eukprot:scaffold66107_cov33-Tisochrysis_lutea.AAC.1
MRPPTMGSPFYREQGSALCLFPASVTVGEARTGGQVDVGVGWGGGLRALRLWRLGAYPRLGGVRGRRWRQSLGWCCPYPHQDSDHQNLGLVRRERGWPLSVPSGWVYGAVPSPPCLL